MVFLLAEKCRVVQLLRKTERLERAAVQRRLWPWHRCGFLRQHVEVLLAPRRSGREEEREKKMEGGVKKTGSAQR